MSKIIIIIMFTVMSESPLLAQLFTHCYVLSFAFKTQTYSYVFRLQTINYIITQLLYKL